jgi:hypothetical protein
MAGPGRRGGFRLSCRVKVAERGEARGRSYRAGNPIGGEIPMRFKLVTLTAVVLLGATSTSFAQNTSSSQGAGAAQGPGTQSQEQTGGGSGTAGSAGNANSGGGAATGSSSTRTNSGNEGSSPADHQTNQRNPGPYAPGPTR